MCPQDTGPEGLNPASRARVRFRSYTPIMPTARIKSGFGRLACALALTLGVAFAPAQTIPAPKLDLIKQATAAMKLDQRIRGLVAQRVDARVEQLRLDHPGLSDSLASVARSIIAAVYEENLEGRDGLMFKVYSVLDRRLTDEDLKFAVNFKGSDQGKRYRELIPRVVAESLEAGRLWVDRLEPEVRKRLEARLRL
jgi:hypothetical protein